MQNQQGQTHQNMQTGMVPPQMNHGGHEIFDVQEVLTAAINTMNLYTIFTPHIQDQELKDIANRQYQFMKQEYNTTLECFKTGQDPTVPTQSYKMEESNDFVYGFTPMGEQKRPVQSANELNDQAISSAMLATVKATAPMKSMAALETTNPVVRRVLADSIPNCIEMAYEISHYQNKHHYYQVPQLNQQDMQQVLNHFAPASNTNLH